jgi:hypothetical protein
MAGETTFGRRQARAAQPRPVAAPRRAPAPSPDDLGPAAEAFRAELASGKAEAGADFAGWRRSQRARTLAAWALGLGLMAPGLISFVVDMPLSLSVGLEALGLVGNWWLRRERRRRLRAIAAWDAPAGQE